MTIAEFQKGDLLATINMTKVVDGFG